VSASSTKTPARSPGRRLIRPQRPPVIARGELSPGHRARCRARPADGRTVDRQANEEHRSFRPQILLIDPPSVLGWQRWRALGERHGLGLIKGALAAIVGQGGLAPDLVEVFARVVLAAIDEIALFVARSDSPDAATLAGTGAIDEVLSRLLASPG
jgi:hypothetical protein